jgi:hypothetical protein
VGPGEAISDHALIIFQALSALPPAQLKGLKSLHYSNYVNEIADYLYSNLSPADLAEWQAMVGPNNNPSDEYRRVYTSWLKTNNNFLFLNFIEDLKSNNRAAAWT